MNILRTKITLRSFILYTFVTLLLLLQYKWFFIPSNFNNFFIKFNTDDSSALISLVILVVIGYIILDKRKIEINKYKFGRYVIFLVFFFVIEVLYTMIRYPQENISRMISSHLYFIVPLFYIILMYFFRKTKSGFKYFLNLFTIFNIILSALMIVTALQYERSGEILLNFYSYEIMTRNGSLRVFSGFGNITTSFVISICIAFFTKTKMKNKIFHILNIFLSFLAIIFVLQTRVQIIISIGILFLAFLLTLNIRKITFGNFILIIIGVFSLVFFVINNNIIDKLSFSNEELSYTYRMESYFYFFEKGLINPLGIGLLTDSNPIYSTILHGPNLTSYITDVGIIGLFGKLGIIIVFWYIMIIYQYYKISINSKGKFKHMSTIIIIFLILTSFTLIYVSYSSIIFFPISMSILEYLYEREV